MPQLDLSNNRRVFRARPKLRVLNGFYPTEPRYLSYTTAPKEDEGILSGMVVTVDASDEFIKSLAAVGDLGAANASAIVNGQSVADALGSSIYLALQDQDEFDAVQAGVIVGLDCSANYEVQTGYFNKSGTYSRDLQLVPGANGELTPLDTLTAGDNGLVVAHVTKVGDEADGSILIPGYAPEATDNTVIQIKTVQPYIAVVPA